MISPEVKLAVQQLYRESGMVFRPDELELSMLILGLMILNEKD